MKKGFTLAELLIVVAIIGVLVGVAVPVFSGRLEKAREAACTANRRSLYGQVVIEHMLSDRSYQEIFDELVGSAGKCPSGGVFSWEDSGETGVIHCSYHGGGGGGGGGAAAPAQIGTANVNIDTFGRGTVIQDETGACVIMSGMWATWQAYSGGTKAAALAADYPDDAKLVDASNIKDSSSETLTEGDVYYDSGSDMYYYVNLVSLYESRPNSSWIPLLK